MKRNFQFPSGKIVTLILCMLVGVISPLRALPYKAYSNQPNITSSLDSSPKLVGDSEICMVLGNTIGIYSGGGHPDDVYGWRIVKSTGEELYKRSGGEQFETIKFAFWEVGEYTVFLKIRRGTNANFFSDQMQVRVQNGPKLTLLPDYLLCGENPVLITALDPNTPNIEKYTINWKDGNGNALGTGNTFTATQAGYYLVEVYLNNPGGSQTCTINGSTYVGPAIDFQITKSKSKVCEGESVSISTDTPLSGEWNVRKLPNGKKISMGTAYGINLSTSQLDGPGSYEVSLRVPSLDFPDCPSLRTTVIEVAAAPQFEIQIIQHPDACFKDNGSFQVKANSNLKSITIPQLDFYKENISEGQVFTFNDLKAKVYLVQVAGTSCNSGQLVELKSKNISGGNSPYKPNLSIRQSNESCIASAVVPGKVSVDLGQSIDNGKFNILSTGRGIVKSGAIPVNGKFEVDLSSGSYLIELIIDGCTYPTESITILGQPQINVSIPSNITICESFYLVPESEDQLLYTLTSPTGKVEYSKTGEGFTLTEKGNYSLLASPLDPNSGLCAKKLNFTTTLLSPFTYTPILIEDSCFDPIRYRVALEGISVDRVNFRWLDSNGVIVGRSREFYPPAIGKFSLLILPKGSGFCPVAPVEFEVVAPITNVPMDFGLGKTCSDPDAVTISLSTNRNEVLTTEWIFYDMADNREEKVDFDDLFDVQVKRSGTYESVAYNKRGCEIGRNLIFVEVSPQYILLELEDSYPVCSKKSEIKPIDPGAYSQYAWYYGSELVSTKRLYNPDKVGDYQLIVTTEDGCEFEDSFTTYDVCSYQIVYPNAMILSDPNKDFRVLMSEGITEAELFVLNRQGELIYHTGKKEFAVETPILNWDGRSNGNYVPTGSYVVVILLRNPLYGIEEKRTGSLQVL